MKVHTTLKELLEAYSDYCQEKSWIEMERDFYEFADEFLASNSLASVEPEPLAKNKDCESKLFNCPKQEYGNCDCKDECIWDFDEIL
tara:strand:+ start:365 stop:625 length:261 start_codon:yes stop_codon:yes gene_type:complete